jgi:hypothetical protein
VTTKKAYDSCRKEGYLYAAQPFNDRTLPHLGAAMVTNLKTLFGGLDTGGGRGRVVLWQRSRQAAMCNVSACSLLPCRGWLVLCCAIGLRRWCVVQTPGGVCMISITAAYHGTHVSHTIHKTLSQLW